MFRVLLFLLVQHQLTNFNAAEEQALSTTADSSTVDNIVFTKLGSYRGFTDDGAEYQKTYFISRIAQTPWPESRSFCQSFNMEHLILETQAEAEAYLNLLNNNLRTAPNGYFWIDGMTVTPKSKTEWFWAKTGKKVSFPIPWYPSEPNNGFDKVYEYCFIIFRHYSNENFLFGDANCNNRCNSACQKIDFMVA